MPVDPKKLEEMINKMLGDVGGAMGAALVLLGDKFGLYKTLAEAGPLTAADLAKRTGTAERYIREWCAAQAAAGYIEYDPASGRFSMSPEQAVLLADENGPAFFPAMFEIVAAAVRDEPKVAEAFRTGGGVGWHEHDPCLFRGTERFFRPGYAAHLVSEWIPALDGVTTLRVPPGTSSGGQLRLRGLGLPRESGGRGDLYATARIQTPTTITAEERALWEQLAAKSSFNPRSQS